MTRERPVPPPERRIFCNRTLNLRAIKAIGYDMDYTLIHYHVEAWERAAYEVTRQKLLVLGWPVQDLSFDPELVIRGLIVDTERGNFIKANRFGYVKQAMHGTKPVPFEDMQRIYQPVIVSLSDPKFHFLNTLFSLSEGCLYAQLVDRLDEGRLGDKLDYAGLYKKVRSTIDEAHVEGALKQEIMADPAKFVDRDSDTVTALLDQKYSGKQLILVTNSEWAYTSAMMTWTFDPYLKGEIDTWRKLFDVVIISSRKPDFFFTKSPLYEVVNEEGLLKPAQRVERGHIYCGGHASHVEAGLDIRGDDILYVGDHIYGDVHVSKRSLSWRTALVLRELEDEVRALRHFDEKRIELERLMAEKESLEQEHAWLRLEEQRVRSNYADKPEATARELGGKQREMRERLARLDEAIGPFARSSTELTNRRWGLLLRTGNDKSHLARQIERYADIYMSRVSNFLPATPFVFLRSHRGSMPHDA